MAKPILVISLKNGLPSIEDRTNIKEKLDTQLGNEYHVLLHFSHDFGEPTFQCFNDCKGLPDVDIEQLIKEFENAPNKDI